METELSKNPIHSIQKLPYVDMTKYEKVAANNLSGKVVPFFFFYFFFYFFLSCPILKAIRKSGPTSMPLNTLPEHGHWDGYSSLGAEQKVGAD